MPSPPATPPTNPAGPGHPQGTRSRPPRPPRPYLALALALAFATLALAGCTSNGPDDGPTTRIVVDFNGERATAQADIPHGVRASQRYYDAEGQTHPDGYTAFDQLVQWSTDSDTAIDVEAFSFGFCLNRIAAIPSAPGCHPGGTAFWSLAVNGETLNVGMGEAFLQPGDVVQWKLTPL